MNMMDLFFNLQIFVQTQYISLFLMNHIYRIPINNNYDIMDQNMNVCSTYIHTYIRAYIHIYIHIHRILYYYHYYIRVRNAYCFHRYIYSCCLENKIFVCIIYNIYIYMYIVCSHHYIVFGKVFSITLDTFDQSCFTNSRFTWIYNYYIILYIYI